MDIKGLYKGLLSSIIGTTLVLSLFFLAYSLVFNQVTANRAKVKAVFEKSSTYEKLPGVIYDNLEKDNQQETKVPLEDPEVRRIALSVFNEDFTRDKIENALDGAYDWLEGSSNQLMVTIDLKQARGQFASKLAEYAKARAKKLPTCNLQQLRQASGSDVFNATCLPPNANLDLIQSQLEKNIAGSEEFLDNPSFNSSDIKNYNNQISNQDIAQFPDTFKTVKAIPLALILFAFGIAYLLIRLGKDKYAAYKRLSRLLGISGVFIFLAPIGILIFAKTAFSRSQADQQINEIALSLIEQFMIEAAKIYYSLGLLLIAAAIGLYIYARKKFKAKDPKNHPKKIPKKPTQKPS